MGGDGVGQRGGNDRLDRHRVLGHGALLDAAGADVVQQQSAHLVAGDQLIAAVGALHGDAHTVGVGVGGQHQVGAGLFGQLQAQLEGLEDLGVGVGAGGKVAVGVLLLGDDGDIGDAHVVQHVGDGHQAGAVQGAVHQLEAGGLAQAGADLAGLDGLVEGLLAVVAHKADQALLHALGKGDILCAGEDVGLLDLAVDDGGGVIGHLAAVGAVGLVAVVLGGVVGRRDHDAGVALIVAGGKAERRDRHERLVDAHMDAVGGEHFGRGFGEHIALDAAVVADGDRLAAALGLDPVGQALGGLTHHIDVHAVCAGTDDAAQTCRAELQCDRKPVLDGRVIVADAFQFGLQIRIVEIGGKPSLIHVFIHL